MTRKVKMDEIFVKTDFRITTADIGGKGTFLVVICKHALNKIGADCCVDCRSKAIKMLDKFIISQTAIKIESRK